MKRLHGMCFTLFLSVVVEETLAVLNISMERISVRIRVISVRAAGGKLVGSFMLMMTVLESYVASQKLTEGADLCTSIISQFVLLLTLLGEAGQWT